MEFKSFPRGQERKDMVKNHAKATEKFQKLGSKAIHKTYFWKDSRTDDAFLSGTMYDSFERIIPEKTLKKYVEDTLRSRKGEAVGVEFGGIGQNLFQSFSDGFFAQTIGVSLVDHRSASKIGDQVISNPTHSVIEADVLSDDTYKKLELRLKGKKVDFIIERMAKGLQLIPPEPFLLSSYLQKWYQLLNDGGLMIVQVPVALNTLLHPWMKLLKEEFKDVLEVDYTVGRIDKDHNCSSFRLRKLPGAPEKLPLLDPRVTRRD